MTIEEKTEQEELETTGDEEIQPLDQEELTEGEEGEAVAPEEEAEEGKRKDGEFVPRGRLNKEIDRKKDLAEQLEAEKEQRRKADERKLELEKQLHSLGPKKEASPRPRRENFADKEDPDEAYDDALMDWKLDGREMAKVEDKRAQLIAHREADFTRDLRVAESKHKDFQEVAFLTAEMKDVIIQGGIKNPGDIAHHFGKNREEAARVMDLPPVAMALELDRLGTKLGAKTPQRTHTRAPTSHAPTGGGGSLVADEKLSNDDWIRKKNMEQYGVEG